MKRTMIITMMFMASFAQAQQMGRVVSVTPINQSVAIPQQTCNQQYVAQPYNNYNGGNALIGAIAGGVIGNAVGGRSYRGYHRGYGRNNGAIALGAISGAIVGSQINSGGGYQPVQNCYTTTTYQNQVVGYNVTYRLNGRTYTTQTESYPGQYIQVNDYSNNYNNYDRNTYSTYPSYNTYVPPPVVYTPVYVAPVYYTPPVRHYHHYRGW